MIPDISIVIPLWKPNPDYLQQCIESVRAQTFRNWEAIFICDQPSREIIRLMTWYEKIDPRIRFYGWHEKTNPARARNAGVEKSAGRYISFLDGDDWWYPEKLQKQIDYMDTHPEIEWCWGYAMVHDGEKEYMLEEAWNKPKANEMLPFQTFVLRRNLVDKIIAEDGSLLDNTLPQIDDYDLFQRLKKYPNYGFKEPLSHYRYHSGGLTSSTGMYKILRMQMKINVKRHRLTNIPHLIRLYLHLRARDALNCGCLIKRRFLQ